MKETLFLIKFVFNQILLYFPIQMMSFAQILLPGTLFIPRIDLLRNNTVFVAL